MEEFRRHGGRLRSGAGALLLSLAVAAALTGGYFSLRHDPASGGAGGAPAARTGAAMAYDPFTGDLVMFGGEGASGQPLAGTWLWNGSAWSVTASADSPSARYGALMAWDPQSQRVILLGGTGGSGCATGDRGDGVGSSGAACTKLQDAWAWDGSDWSQLDLGGGAGQLGHYSLVGASMATDPASGRIVLVTANSPATQLVPITGTSGSSSGGAPAASAGAVSGGASGSAASGGVCIGVDGGPCGSPAALPTAISVPPIETACPLTTGCTSSSCPMPATSPGAGPSIDIACAVPCASTASSCGICPLPSGVASPAGGAEVTCSNCPAIATPCPLLAATLTWVFDGSSFQQVAADPSSSPPSGGEVVWFPEPGRLVDLSPAVYAAINCPAGAPCPIAPPADDWTWTGAGWTSLDVLSSSAATPLFETPPVSDPAAGDVVGVDAGGATWTSTNPASGWVEASPADAPAARTGFALAFDGATGQVVLFGGELLGTSSVAGAVVGDTWTWDGSDWSLSAGVAPSPAATGSATPAPSASALPAPWTPVASPDIAVPPSQTAGPSATPTS